MASSKQTTNQTNNQNRSYASMTQSSIKNDISSRTLLLKAECNEQSYATLGKKICDQIKSQIKKTATITDMAYNAKSTVWNITISTKTAADKLAGTKIYLLNERFSYLRPKQQEVLLITILCDATVLDDEITQHFSSFGDVIDFTREPVPWDKSICSNKRKLFLKLHTRTRMKDLPLSLVVGEFKYPIYYRGKVFTCAACNVRHSDHDDCNERTDSESATDGETLQCKIPITPTDSDTLITKDIDPQDKRQQKVKVSSNPDTEMTANDEVTKTVTTSAEAVAKPSCTLLDSVTEVSKIKQDFTKPNSKPKIFRQQSEQFDRISEDINKLEDRFFNITKGRRISHQDFLVG